MPIPEQCQLCHGEMVVEIVAPAKLSAEKDFANTTMVDCPVCKGVGEVLACA